MLFDIFDRFASDIFILVLTFGDTSGYFVIEGVHIGRRINVMLDFMNDNEFNFWDRKISINVDMIIVIEAAIVREKLIKG
jgi:hypothetical protein